MFRAIFVLFLSAIPAFAQRDAKIPDPDPELERQSFIVAPGFEVTLWAADPLLDKPIQMNWDSAGRLWVATSEVYPQIEPGQKANDKVLILEDTKGTGKADKVTVFADGLLIPTAVLPGDGGAYVANSTEIVHLSASKRGGKADQRRIVLSGFGTEDTHHIIHTFRWGPDGCLYFNQSIYIHSHVETPTGVQRLNAGGIWRFRPETNELSVFARGWINPWGHAFDKYGQSFVTDGAGGEGINHAIPGAYFMESKGPHAGRILHGLNPGSPKYCGLEILSGRHLPDDWQGDLITNDFRGHRVCRFKLQDDGSTFSSRELPELIKTNHPAFRPIDVKMGPDGAIYIADWYNPIIQHGEVDFRDPRRDHTHGRIWRVTAKGRPLVKKPDLVTSTVPQLLEHLKDPEGWTREQVRRVLKERGKEKVLPDLAAWVTKLDPKNPAIDSNRLEALWLYQALDVPEPSLLSLALTSKDSNVRAAACRVVGGWAGKAPVSVVQMSIDSFLLVARSLKLADVMRAARSAGLVNVRELVVPKGKQTFIADQGSVKDVQAFGASVVKGGIHPVTLADLTRIEIGKLSATGGDPLVQLEARVRDDHARVRLEAIRALSAVNSAKAAGVAVAALYYPLDRTLDYGLWLTARELAPQWLPEYLAGKGLGYVGELDHLAFLIDAVGAKEAISPLRKSLESSHSLNTRAWEVVARLGDGEDVGAALRRAYRHVNADFRRSVLAAVEEVARDRRVKPPDDVIALVLGWSEADKMDRETRCRLVGIWKVESERSVLESVAVNPGDIRNAERRAAIDALLELGGGKTRDFLIRSLTESRVEPLSRVLVLSALVRVDPNLAAKRSVEFLVNPTVPAENFYELFSAFLRKKGSPQLLIRALAGKTLPHDVAKVGIRALRASAQNSPELIAALTKAGNLKAARPYPTEAEVKQLTGEVSKLGDPIRGELVFRKKENQCLNCHAIGGAGGRVGPDLTGVGASAQIDYLVESLLNPNKAVKEGYHAVKVTTLGGKVVQGVPVKEANGELTLRDSEDKEVVIPVNQIDEKVPTRSLMADGLADPLTKQELLDLVRFLSELGKVGPYGPSTSRLVRRWQTVDGGNANTNKMRQARIAAVADPGQSFLWLPAYSTAGGNLPLADLPKFTVWNNTAAQSVVRCQLDVTTAGKVRLKFNDATGLAVYLGSAPVEAKSEIDLNVPTGMQTVTLIVDRSLRKQDLRIELDDVAGSPARATIVGGK
ncbi:MAG TPA: PVC-type heme-binding CxxCH protein [Fimbriiglobus sp.]